MNPREWALETRLNGSANVPDIEELGIPVEQTGPREIVRVVRGLDENLGSVVSLARKVRDVDERHSFINNAAHKIHNRPGTVGHIYRRWIKERIYAKLAVGV